VSTSPYKSRNAAFEIDSVAQQKAQLVQQTVEIGNELGEAISMFGLDDAPIPPFLHRDSAKKAG
ncbi:MAG TPA: hypothetical protein DD676_13610, partial [Halomonas sp.]|nr:hypothetical protein [Halomonas sp.]